MPRTLPMMFPLMMIAACKGGSTGDDTGSTDDSSPVEAECAEDTECLGYQICDDEECVTGDRNNAIDEAQAMIWETPVSATLQDAGDLDYFSFVADGGEFVRITTEPTTSSEEMDTFVTLYSPSGKVHAQENDHAAGSVNTYDTVLYAYLPTAGTWTIAVQDLNGAGGSTFTYDVMVRETGAHTSEDDSFGDANYNLEPEANVYYAIGVVLEEAGDTDWIELDLPYEECPVYVYASAYETGSDMNITAEMLNDDAERLLYKENLGLDGAALYFEVDGQKAWLGVSDASGGGGDDYWAMVYVRIGDRGYSYQVETEANDLQAEANLIPTAWDTNSYGNVGASSAWGTMDYPGDEDWFAFEVDADHYISVAGTADSLGSGFDGYIEVYDAAGNLLLDESEGDDDFPDVFYYGPVDAGTYYVRVLDEAGNVAGPYYYYRLTMYQTDYSTE